VRRPVAAALHSSAIIGALAVDGLRLLQRREAWMGGNPT